MKHILLSTVGCVGSALAFFLGGWDASVITLGIFMAIDMFTGFIVAGVFHKSKKTESGSLKSIIGFKGISKKCMILLFVGIGHMLDMFIGVAYIREAICIAYMANELISIVENAGLMGIPIPSVITKAIDILHNNENEVSEQ